MITNYESARPQAQYFKARLVATVLFLVTHLAGSPAFTQEVLELPRIAHAGGQVNGATYTNSLEALEENYAAGFRAFEIDFSFTSDGELVCLHDWEESFTRSFGLPPGSPVSLQEFEQLVRERSEFTKCTLANFMLWFDAHQDALLITDVKEQNVAALEHISTNYPQFLPRIIPQIYQPEEYQAVAALGFENLIWTLYLYPGGTQSVLNNLPDMSLWAVTMNTDRAQGDLPRLLADLGMPSYAHTINQYADFLYLKSLGIDEIYTDALSGIEEVRFEQAGRVSWQDSSLLKARDALENERARRIEQFSRLSTVHYSLANDFEASAITSNQVTILDSQSDVLEFVATGRDPYINFSPLSDASEEIAVFIDIEVPDDTVVEVFYTTRDQPDFSASRRVSERISAGENRVVIAVDETSPVTRVRLDPGTVAGNYSIKSFEIRSNSRSWLRFLPWN